jgi:hypothetical protein
MKAVSPHPDRPADGLLETIGSIDRIFDLEATSRSPHLSDDFNHLLASRCWVEEQVKVSMCRGSSDTICSQ